MSQPSERARKPDASRSSSETKVSAAKPTPNRAPISSSSARRDALDVVRPRRAPRRSGAGSPAGAGRPLPPARPRCESGRAGRRPPGLRAGAPRPRRRPSPTRTPTRRGRRRSTRLCGSLGAQIIGSAHPPGEGASPISCRRGGSLLVAKMGRTGPLSASEAHSRSRSLGDANRGAPAVRGEQLGRARRTDPPERRAFSCPRPAGATFLTRISRSRGYRGARFGETASPRLAARLLRRCRAGGRDGRAGPRALRRARLRPQADRPQLPRRARPRASAARSSSTRSRTCPRARRGRLLRARDRPGRAHEAPRRAG